MTPPAPLPLPPADLLQRSGAAAPALDLEAWVRAELVEEGRPLTNYDHELLREYEPRVGFLWVTEAYNRKGQRVLGTAQVGEPSGHAWARLQRAQQLAEWFGEVPAFVITLDAVRYDYEVRRGRPQNALATVEHELYHCGQDAKADGSPRFDRDGFPVWGIRPHDVEQFVGVVRRYGTDAARVHELVAAALHANAHGPEVGPAQLDGLCGTCLRLVA